ncbi:c-type cytochrome [Ralstonia syzygii]|uniref:Sulfite oxidation cytochrome c-551 n=1 Tax=Ralstonia syzygii R24 TaxID=907261 RepID=G3A2I7_9RALS|nr:c-type cytochrome [Ralstonia syzygii]CCA85638.1 sulfite oxidation cytochrome c-551 [Ralstonia syzygii R24]
MKFAASLAAGAVLAGLALSCAPVQAAVDAARAQTIANQNACLGCHAANRKLVGPSYQDVAAKYKGDAGAQAKLVKKVREGGLGVWGQIPMPANPKISDADLKTVIDWVLAGAPAK